jgi:hypothetical protein
MALLYGLGYGNNLTQDYFYVWTDGKRKRGKKSSRVELDPV